MELSACSQLQGLVATSIHNLRMYICVCFMALFVSKLCIHGSESRGQGRVGEH